MSPYVCVCVCLHSYRILENTDWLPSMHKALGSITVLTEVKNNNNKPVLC